jgi:uncharacterized protein
VNDTLLNNISKENPPRASKIGSAIILITVVLYTIIAFLPKNKISFISIVVLLTLLLLSAILIKSLDAIHLTLFCVISAGMIELAGLAGSILPWYARQWPAPVVVAIAIYAAIVLPSPKLRRSIRWIKLGVFNREIIILVIITVLLSSAALFMWYKIAQPDSGIFRDMVPQMPVYLLPFAGLFFAMFNAFAEETIYRGVMMNALDRALGEGYISVVIQGLSFGIMHIEGFPRGISGVILASIYGIMLGLIRRKSVGMFAPWLAHVFADITIFSIIVLFMI